MCISEPHLRTTHVSTIGSNAASVSTRFPDFTVGCPPPQLLEPTHCPRTGRVLRPSTLDEASVLSLVLNDAYGAPRSGTGTWSGGATGSAAAPVAHPSQVPRIQMTARRTRAASRRARSPTLPVERKHRESPPGRQSQPRGVRAHGHHWRLGTGVGQEPGGLQTIPPWRLRSPNLACKMRQRHAARIQTAQRRDPQRPHGRDTERHQHQHPHTTEHEDADRITGVGMCCVEGLTAALECGFAILMVRCASEVVVGPPR